MLILFEPLRLRHLPYPRYRAAEEDIATYPLSTAHHTLTENTPYRSNRRGGHCCVQPRTQISQRVCHSIGLSTINSQPTLRLIAQTAEEDIAAHPSHIHRLHCMFAQLHQSLNPQL